MSAFRAIAVDYDGTLAVQGPPAPSTLDAIDDARHRGLRVVVVTGRILAELRGEFPEIGSHADVIVAENGAVVATGLGVELLAPPIEPVVFTDLMAQGVPCRRGEVIVATQLEHREAVAATLQALGLDHQLMSNRAELMVVPAGVTKATGLRVGLAALGISCHSTLAVGDAENDHSLLQACEVGVAVANAVDALKKRADVVTTQPDGDGVRDVLSGPLLSGEQRVHPDRWRLVVGDGADGAVTIPSSQLNILVSGPSGSGKSHTAGMLAEQLIHLGYSMLVIDPEGDYGSLAALPNVFATGGHHPVADVDDIMSLYRHPGSSVVIDVSLRPRQEIQTLFRKLPPLVAVSRAAVGVPHWILLDEAHGPLGRQSAAAQFFTPDHLGYLLATYHPDKLSPLVRASIDVELQLTNHPLGTATLQRSDGSFEVVRLAHRVTQHSRHWHKYASTTLPPDRGFWFRCDDRQLTGAVSCCLAEFHRELSTAPGPVLVHHAVGTDFSRWIDDVYRDHQLAHDIQAIERRIATAPNSAALELLRHDLLAVLERRLLDTGDALVSQTAGMSLELRSWPAR